MKVADLKARREHHGISLQSLADDLGYTRQALWRWERGADDTGGRTPHGATLKAWRLALEARIASARMAS